MFPPIILNLAPATGVCVPFLYFINFKEYVPFFLIFGIVIFTVLPTISAVTSTLSPFSNSTVFLAAPLSKETLSNLYIIWLFSSILFFVTFTFSGSAIL